MLGLTVGSALSGCMTSPVKSQAAVCRLRFDYQDKALAELNTQNIRALLAFREICP